MKKIAVLVLILLTPMALLANSSGNNNSGNSADQSADTYDASAAFEVLKSLEGTWRGTVGAAGEEARETEIVYEVSAGGHSVIQTFSPGKPYEMFSVYHMDGDELLMTHYCAIGNAPKMKFSATGAPGELAWEFNGGTNLDPNKDAHAHEGRMQITGADSYTSRSIGWKDGKPSSERTFSMQREE